MSRSDQIHRKEREIAEIERDMGGINPGLALYKTLSERRKKLRRELDDLVEIGSSRN
jgi:hypothetical protein